ncbi:Nramp family divalent metal transporter [Membranicola marinus]|uniref:Nramp family divalent metal transporter n=1 Tax=Membranihabitans marinus TaxID=1227546 RepID=A0A953HXY8_9BACT|nr:Nramp family divalent metal transporter [Membranihabitans marinus]MBY5960250.1 Nramp family divalent metal transporter [Membranihabitans marinus]
MGEKKSLLSKLWLLLLSVGPGIFCIGYTIGTGSVTSMAKAGSEFGMQLLWVLVLSVVFAGVLMEAYGRYAVVTGDTAIHSFRKRFHYGPILAIAVIVGVVMGQLNSLSGIVGLSANAIYELIHVFFPSTSPQNYWAVLGISIFILAVLYGLLWVGKYSFFEKILVIFVTLMGLCFLLSMFVVMPDPKDIVKGLVPSIPAQKGGKLMVAAFVGTTMAAPTFVVRPLLMKGKGWGKEDLKAQSRDALVGAFLMFVVSASIMITATGALFYDGKIIEQVLDMIYTLEPVAGRFAIVLFVVGILSAGLSSIFPILMVAPLLIADYSSGELDTSSRQFRLITGLAAIIGLVVPILGANPIVAQIATQVANVFVLPLVIILIIFLVNNRKIMGENKSGWLLNLGLFSSFVFSCFIAYNGVLALLELI